MATQAEITSNSNTLADDMIRIGPVLRVTNMQKYVQGLKDGLGGDVAAVHSSDSDYWDYRLGYNLSQHMRTNPNFEFVERQKET